MTAAVLAALLTEGLPRAFASLETDDGVSQPALEAGWNLVTAETADLARRSGGATAVFVMDKDVSTQMHPDAPIEPYRGYWVFVGQQTALEPPKADDHLAHPTAVGWTFVEVKNPARHQDARLERVLWYNPKHARFEEVHQGEWLWPGIGYLAYAPPTADSTPQRPVAPSRLIATRWGETVALRWQPTRFFDDGSRIPAGLTPSYRIYRTPVPKADEAHTPVPIATIDGLTYEDRAFDRGSYAYVVTTLIKAQTGNELESETSARALVPVSKPSPRVPRGAFEIPYPVDDTRQQRRLLQTAATTQDQATVVYVASVTNSPAGDRIEIFRSPKSGAQDAFEPPLQISPDPDFDSIEDLALAVSSEKLVLAWIERSNTRPPRFRLRVQEGKSADDLHETFSEPQPGQTWKNALSVAIDPFGSTHMIWNEGGKVFYAKDHQVEARPHTGLGPKADFRHSIFDQKQQKQDSEPFKYLIKVDPSLDGHCACKDCWCEESYLIGEDSSHDNTMHADEHPGWEQTSVYEPQLLLTDEHVVVVGRQDRMWDAQPVIHEAWATMYETPVYSDKVVARNQPIRLVVGWKSTWKRSYEPGDELLWAGIGHKHQYLYEGTWHETRSLRAVVKPLVATSPVGAAAWQHVVIDGPLEPDEDANVHPQLSQDPGGPLYVAYEKGDHALHLAVSEDQGLHWSVPKPIATRDQALHGHLRGLAIAHKAPVGDLNILYNPIPARLHKESQPGADLIVARSHDGGEMFTIENLDPRAPGDDLRSRDKADAYQQPHEAHHGPVDFKAYEELLIAVFAPALGEVDGHRLMMTRASWDQSIQKLKQNVRNQTHFTNNPVPIDLQLVNKHDVAVFDTTQQAILTPAGHAQPVRNLGASTVQDHESADNGALEPEGVPIFFEHGRATVSLAAGMAEGAIHFSDGTQLTLSSTKNALPGNVRGAYERALRERARLTRSIDLKSAFDSETEEPTRFYGEQTLPQETAAQYLVEYRLDPDSSHTDPTADATTRDAKYLASFQRVWAYTLGIALAQAARGTDLRAAEQAGGMARYLCAHAVLDPNHNEELRGWHFSWNTQNDNWRDARLVTGATAWAIHGLGVFLSAEGPSRVIAHGPDKPWFQTCYERSLRGLLRHRKRIMNGEGATVSLMTAGWTTAGLSQIDRVFQAEAEGVTPTYYSVLDAIGYESYNDEQPPNVSLCPNGTPCSKPLTHTLSKAEWRRLQEKTEAHNVVTEHNLDVLSVLNHALAHRDILGLNDSEDLGYEALRAWRDELQAGIFTLLWDDSGWRTEFENTIREQPLTEQAQAMKRILDTDEALGRIITGGGRVVPTTQTPNGQALYAFPEKSAHTAIDNCTWLALSVDYEDLSHEESNKLAQCLRYAIIRFAKPLGFFSETAAPSHQQSYYGTHYFQNAFRDPYIEPSALQASSYHLEATMGMILGLITYAKARPEHHESDAFAEVAYRMWADAERFVRDHGFAYSSQRIQDLSTLLSSSTAVLWFIDTYDHLEGGTNLDQPLPHYAHRFDVTKGARWLTGAAEHVRVLSMQDGFAFGTEAMAMALLVSLAQNEDLSAARWARRLLSEAALVPQGNHLLALYALARFQTQQGGISPDLDSAIQPHIENALTVFSALRGKDGTLAQNEATELFLSDHVLLSFFLDQVAADEPTQRWALELETELQKACRLGSAAPTSEGAAFGNLPSRLRVPRSWVLCALFYAGNGDYEEAELLLNALGRIRAKGHAPNENSTQAGEGDPSSRKPQGEDPSSLVLLTSVGEALVRRTLADADPRQEELALHTLLGLASGDRDDPSGLGQPSAALLLLQPGGHFGISVPPALVLPGRAAPLSSEDWSLVEQRLSWRYLDALRSLLASDFRPYVFDAVLKELVRLRFALGGGTPEQWMTEFLVEDHPMLVQETVYDGLHLCTQADVFLHSIGGRQAVQMSLGLGPDSCAFAEQGWAHLLRKRQHQRPGQFSLTLGTAPNDEALAWTKLARELESPPHTPLVLTPDPTASERPELNLTTATELRKALQAGMKAATRSTLDALSQEGALVIDLNGADPAKAFVTRSSSYWKQNDLLLRTALKDPFRARVAFKLHGQPVALPPYPLEKEEAERRNAFRRFVHGWVGGHLSDLAQRTGLDLGRLHHVLKTGSLTQSDFERITFLDGEAKDVWQEALKPLRDDAPNRSQEIALHSPWLQDLLHAIGLGTQDSPKSLFEAGSPLVDLSALQSALAGHPAGFDLGDSPPGFDLVTAKTLPRFKTPVGTIRPGRGLYNAFQTLLLSDAKLAAQIAPAAIAVGYGLSGEHDVALKTMVTIRDEPSPEWTQVGYAAPEDLMHTVAEGDAWLLFFHPEEHIRRTQNYRSAEGVALPFDDRRIYGFDVRDLPDLLPLDTIFGKGDSGAAGFTAPDFIKVNSAVHRVGVFVLETQQDRQSIVDRFLSQHMWWQHILHIAAYLPKDGTQEAWLNTMRSLLLGWFFDAKVAAMMVRKDAPKDGRPFWWRDRPLGTEGMGVPPDADEASNPVSDHKQNNTGAIPDKKPTSTTDPERETVVIPLERIAGGYVTIPMTIEEHPLRLVLNTSTAQSSLYRKALHTVSSEASSNVDETMGVSFSQGAIGPLTFTDFKLPVTDDALTDLADGELGTDFLSQFTIELDLPSNVLRLHPLNAVSEGRIDVSKLQPLAYRSQGGRVILRTEVPGHAPFSTLLDTGSLTTIIHSDTVTKPFLEGLKRKRNAAGKETYVFERMWIADRPFTSTAIEWNNDPIDDSYSGNKRIMLMGLDWLQERVVIDPVARLFYFGPKTEMRRMNWWEYEEEEAEWRKPVTMNGPTVFPLVQHSSSRHILIPVTIGSKTYQFALDTGASDSTIQPQTLESLAADAYDPMAASTTTRQPFTGENIAIDLIRLKDAHVGHLPMDAILHTYDTAALYGPKDRIPDGILGGSFLHHYVVDIDFLRGEVRLHPKDALVSGSIDASNLSHAPLTFDRGTPLAQSHFPGGDHFQALLDSGAAHSYINARAASTKTPVRTEKITFGNWLPPSPHNLLHYNAFQAGPITIRQPAFILTQDIGNFNLELNREVLGPANTANAIVGLDLLAGKRVLFDYAHRKVYVEHETQNEALKTQENTTPTVLSKAELSKIVKASVAEDVELKLLSWDDDRGALGVSVEVKQAKQPEMDEAESQFQDMIKQRFSGLRDPTILCSHDAMNLQRMVIEQRARNKMLFIPKHVFTQSVPSAIPSGGHGPKHLNLRERSEYLPALPLYCIAYTNALVTLVTEARVNPNKPEKHSTDPNAVMEKTPPVKAPEPNFDPPAGHESDAPFGWRRTTVGSGPSSVQSFSRPLKNIGLKLTMMTNRSTVLVDFTNPQKPGDEVTLHLFRQSPGKPIADILKLRYEIDRQDTHHKALLTPSNVLNQYSTHRLLRMTSFLRGVKADQTESIFGFVTILNDGDELVSEVEKIGESNQDGDLTLSKLKTPPIVQAAPASPRSKVGSELPKATLRITEGGWQEQLGGIWFEVNQDLPLNVDGFYVWCSHGEQTLQNYRIEARGDSEWTKNRILFAPSVVFGRAFEKPKNLPPSAPPPHSGFFKLDSDLAYLPALPLQCFAFARDWIGKTTEFKRGGIPMTSIVPSLDFVSEILRDPDVHPPEAALGWTRAPTMSQPSNIVTLTRPQTTLGLSLVRTKNTLHVRFDTPPPRHGNIKIYLYKQIDGLSPGDILVLHFDGNRYEENGIELKEADQTRRSHVHKLNIGEFFHLTHKAQGETIRGFATIMADPNPEIISEIVPVDEAANP